MQETANPLRGLIASQFGSIRKFANFLGWSYSKTYRIVNRISQPDASDIGEMADALHLHDGDMIVGTFILPYCSQNAN